MFFRILKLSLLAVVWQSVCGQLVWEIIHNGTYTQHVSDTGPHLHDSVNTTQPAGGMQSNSTSQQPGNYPAARQHAGLGFDPATQQLVLFGGSSERAGSSAVYDDTWIFSLRTGVWREVMSEKSPSPRHSFVSGVGGGCLYVATGRGEHAVFYNDIWRFNIKSETWEELQQHKRPDYYTAQQWQIQLRIRELQPAYRYGAAGGIYRNASRVYVHAGYSTHSHGDMLTYNINDMSWFQETADVGLYSRVYPHSRSLHAGVMLSETDVLVYGGCLSGCGTGGACPSSDSWFYNGKLRTWTQLHSCASPRIHASLALLPSRLGQRRALLYGGQEKSIQVLHGSQTADEQVAIFDPDTLRWALKATSGEVPAWRVGVALVTSDSGIYMFGGADRSGQLYNDLHLLRGDALLADQSATHALCSPPYFTLVMLHGIFMALAWGFFLQWGAFLVRYTSALHPSRGIIHRLFQGCGLLVALAGLVAAVISVRTRHFTHSHAQIGLALMIGAVLNPVLGAMRAKHAGTNPVSGEESLSGALWRLSHQLLGYGLLALGLANTSLGLALGQAHDVLWICWHVYLALLLLVRVVAEIRHQQRMGNGCLGGASLGGKRRTYLVSEQTGAQNHGAHAQGAFQGATYYNGAYQT